MRAALAAVLLYSYAAGAAPAESPPTPPPAVSAPAESSSHWPGAHAFGIRAGLGGSSATPGIDVGNVGIAFLLSDSMALSADFGLGLTTGAGAAEASFAVDAMLSIYLRGMEHDLRPYVPLLFGIGFGSSQAAPVYSAQGYVINQGESTSSFQVAFGGGIGAEYWLAKSFSLAAELMLRFEVTSSTPIALRIGTLTPGVRATYWF